MPWFLCRKQIAIFSGIELFSVWKRGTTADSATGNDDGKAWQSTRVHVSRHIFNSDKPINIVLEEVNQDERKAGIPGKDNRTEEQATGESGDEPEYDESSDEDEVRASDERGNYLQGEIGSSTTFLLGVKSRFGRAIRFNNHLLS